jgi:hypothetical protein
MADGLRIEERPVKKQSWFSRNKIIIIIGSTIIILAIVVGIVLAVVLSTSSSSSSTDVSNTDSRIDCLPWYKEDSSVDLEVECSKVSYCAYKFSKDSNIPRCYIKPDTLKVKISDKVSTELGENHTLTYNDVATRAARQLVLQFEFLDDNTLRFKVSILDSHPEFHTNRT